MKVYRKKSQFNYRISIELGLILSLILAITAFKVNIKTSVKDTSVYQNVQEEVYMEEIVQTKQELKAPAPPKPSVPIEVPNDEIIEDEIIEIDAELDLDASLEIPVPPRPPQETNEGDEEIFIVVEQPPVLIGGIASLQKMIVYPKLAMTAGIEGKVIVQFVIDAEGKVKNPFVVRGIGGGCDEEALKAVSNAQFKPGMQRGRPVQVQYTLPITFKLKDANS